MKEPAHPQTLKRSLTFWLALLYRLGVTIGAGIYVLVGITARRSGRHAPLAFVFAALVMSVSAAGFAELETRMPVSASEAAYVENAFNWPWLSLTMGLLVVLMASISAATISVGSARYIGVFVDLPPPWIRIQSCETTPPAQVIACAMGAGRRARFEHWTAVAGSGGSVTA